MAHHSFLGMFRKAPPVVKDITPARPAPLPDVVTAVLDAASVLFRPDTGNDARSDHAIVQLPNGSVGWRFSPEAAAKVVAHSWPDLDEYAVAQAARRLGGLVATRRKQQERDAAFRAAVCNGSSPHARPYLHRY